MIKYAKFRDPELETRILTTGYVVIPSFLGAAQVNALFAIYDQCHSRIKAEQGSTLHSAPNDRGAYWSSLHSLDDQSSADLSKQVLEILKPELAGIFDDWECPIGAMLSKYPGEMSQFDAHRDGSVLDESKFGYRNLWMPLVDVNEMNGALYVLPKSHLYLNEIWPMVNKGAKWPYTQFNNIVERYAKTLYAKKGDLIVYDQALTHGSWQNRSDSERPVVHFGILPKEYEMVFYKVESIIPEISVTAYKVNPDFYFQKHCNDQLLKEEDIIFRRKFNYQLYTGHEFEILLREALS